MKVFVSWSGERSQALAHALRDWLPLVLHYVEPWLSEADVAAGDRWAEAIARELEASNFGIICVTPENADSPWLLFEAGALAKSMHGARVIPLLLNLEFSDITGPLAQFQAKKVDRSGLSEVVHSINDGLEESIPEARAKQLFEALWPEFEKSLTVIPAEAPTERHMRPQHEILEELVSGVRGLDTRFREFETTVSDQETSPRRRRLRPVHPVMIEELSMSISDSPDDPISLLIIAGLFRDDFPWLHEVMVEAYREIRSGDGKAARRAMQRVQRIVREMSRGRFMEEMFGGSSRDAQMLMMELPRLLDHLLHREPFRGERLLHDGDEEPTRSAD